MRTYRNMESKVSLKGQCTGLATRKRRDKPDCLLAHSQNCAKLQKTSTYTAGANSSWVAFVRDVNTARSVSLLGHTASSQQYGKMTAMSCSRASGEQKCEKGQPAGRAMQEG